VSAVRVVLIVAAGALAAMAGSRLAAQAPSGGARRTLADGLYTAAQASRGKAAYESHCAECHMADLGGHEYAGPLAGEGFQLKWQDASLAEFFGRVRSMPLGRPGLLTRDEYLDIVAYALQKNGYPEGPAELTPASVGGWPPIRIERVRRAPGAAR